MTTTITILVDNLAQGRGLRAEHGLSMLIESDAGALLFDCGQSDLVCCNASQLKANLGGVQALALSHGHYDHTGGMAAVLEQLSAVPVYAHPHALAPKYAVDGEQRAIGLPLTRAQLEAQGARFELDAAPRSPLPGMTLTGQVPRRTDFERVTAKFQRDVGNGLEHDTMLDDQALLLDTASGAVVILGCTHAGLINTLHYARELTGSSRFAAVIGGTHLVDADEARLQATNVALGDFDIGLLAPIHCTGFRGQASLYQALGDRYRIAGVGTRLAF